MRLLTTLTLLVATVAALPTEPERTTNLVDVSRFDQQHLLGPLSHFLTLVYRKGPAALSSSRVSTSGLHVEA